MGAEDPQKETKLGMYIFIGVLGALSLGYLAFFAEPKKKGA